MYIGIVEEISVGRLSDDLFKVLVEYGIDNERHRAIIIDTLKYSYEMRLMIDSANIELDWTERLYLNSVETTLLDSFKKYLNGNHGLFGIEMFFDYYKNQLNYIYKYYVEGNKSKAYLSKYADIHYWNQHLLQKNLTREANIASGRLPLLAEEKFKQIGFNKCGIYFLYNDNDELIYIGKSQNLRTRILQSADIRGATKFCYAYTDSLADMHLYEVYYISKYKPILNKEFNSTDGLSIVMPGLKVSDLYDLYF